MTLIIGILGATTVLIAFLLSQFKIWNQDTVWYDLLNFIGSLLLVIYAVLLKSYPFIILNTIWGLISLKDVINFFIKEKSGN